MLSFICIILYTRVVLGTGVHSNEFKVPEFDIGLFTSSGSRQQQDLASIIDKSFQLNGIIKLVNTSLFPVLEITETEMDELYTTASAFFEKMSLEDKMKFAHVSVGTPGYVPPKSEGFTETLRNLREAFTFVRDGNAQRLEPYNDPPILYGSVAQFMSRMDNEILKPFLDAVTLSLNITEHNLESMVYYKQLNINYYFEINIDDNNNRIEFRHVPHIDGNGFSFLWTDDKDGLQIYCNITNQWYDIKSDTNSIFVMNGELIPFYTQNRWKSLLHRVIYSKNSYNQKRISYVLFTSPDLNSIIYPWKSCDNEQDDEYDQCSEGLNVKSFYEQYMDRIKFYDYYSEH